MIFVFYFLIKAALGERLRCDDILTPVNEISFNDTQFIETSYVIECLQKINDKQLSRDRANLIWDFLVEHYKGVSNVPEEVLLNLRWVTPAIKAEDYSNLTLGDVDVIEKFGLDYNLSYQQLSAIAERVKEDFGSKEPEDYTSFDLKALGNILCAFNRSEIERIHASEYKDAAEVIGKLKCRPHVMLGFANLAIKKEAFGSAALWDEDIISEVGLVVKYLPKKVKDKLSRSSKCCNKLLLLLVIARNLCNIVLESVINK